MDSLRQALLAHAERYPDMEPVDYIKLVYQNEFGNGHFIEDAAGCEAGIRTEYLAFAKGTGGAGEIEDLGGGLCRVPLTAEFLSPDGLPLLNRLFVLTASQKRGDMDSFREKLSDLFLMAGEGVLPVEADSIRRALEEYEAAGFPAIHHSSRFRERHQPHYRVIDTRYAFYFSLLQALWQARERNERLLAAIDGRCGSGKTLLAGILAEVFSCPVFHMDDFFLPPARRAPDCMETPAGNMDLNRFLGEVLLPLSEGREARYRPWSCGAGEFGPERRVSPGWLGIIEGSYSLHPSLRERYGPKVFLTCPPNVQAARILGRGGKEVLERFEQMWIPMEERYFSSMRPAECCQWTFDTSALRLC